MLLIFSFSLNPETNEAAIAGNIPAVQALNILQQLVIAEAVQKAKSDGGSQPAEVSDVPN